GRGVVARVQTRGSTGQGRRLVEQWDQPCVGPRRGATAGPRLPPGRDRSPRNGERSLEWGEPAARICLRTRRHPVSEPRPPPKDQPRSHYGCACRSASGQGARSVSGGAAARFSVYTKKRCPSGAGSYDVTNDEYGCRVTPRIKRWGASALNRPLVTTATDIRSPAGFR